MTNKIIDGVLIGLSESEEANLVLAQLDQQKIENVKRLTLYKEQRALAYPPMADYLDGIVKNDISQIEKYMSDCLAIKAKYPKP